MRDKDNTKILNADYKFKKGNIIAVSQISGFCYT